MPIAGVATTKTLPIGRSPPSSHGAPTTQSGDSGTTSSSASLASIGATEQVDRDARWLPHLAPHLPVAVPEPIAIGEPEHGYPFRWLCTVGRPVRAPPSTGLMTPSPSH